MFEREVRMCILLLGLQVYVVTLTMVFRQSASRYYAGQMMIHATGCEQIHGSLFWKIYLASSPPIIKSPIDDFVSWQLDQRGILRLNSARRVGPNIHCATGTVLYAVGCIFSARFLENVCAFFAPYPHG